MSAQAILNRRLKLVDDTADVFSRRLARVADDLEKRMVRLIAAGKENASVDAALARAQIERLLVESGFYEVGDELLNGAYQEILAESYAVYRDLLPGLKFGDLDTGRLNAIKQMDFATFNALGTDSVNTLQKIFLDLNFGASSMDSAIEQLRVTLQDQFKRYADSYVRTSVHAFERVASSEIALQGGLNRFKYIGPLDSITREFCRDYIGEVKTWEEWSQISNPGQPGPITVFGGGHNCRHELVPVIDM